MRRFFRDRLDLRISEDAEWIANCLSMGDSFFYF